MATLESLLQKLLCYNATCGYPLNITTTGADQVVEGPDPKRMAVVIGTCGVAVNLAFGQLTGGANVGQFLIAANSPPFQITRDVVGDMITQEIHLNATTANKVGLWIGQCYATDYM